MMPELSLQQIVLVLGVGLFTAAAAVSDLRTRRIPNALTVPVFLLGLIYQASFGGWGGLADAGLAFAVGFGTLLVLWLIGGGGGGDVKLIGALSVWLGFRMTLAVLVVSTVFVLAGTLGVMAWSMIVRGPFNTKRKFIATDKPGKKTPATIEERQQRRIMAYAVPVALATWLVMIAALWRPMQP